jgi:hypothetical protein
MPAGQALTFPIEVFVLVVLPFGSFYYWRSATSSAQASSFCSGAAEPASVEPFVRFDFPDLVRIASQSCS